MEIDKVFNNDVDGVADNLFSAVKNSVSEIKAMQQRKAAENVQLVIRALKKLETELRETNEDVANQLALRIASIKDGRDGKDGKNGKDGRDGKAGRDGKDGNKGDKGADGRDGVDGVDGVSVVNANIDFDGSLVITLSDGREINVGEVVAPDLAERIKVISTMSTNGAVGIKDEGSSISTGVKTINFVGATVTATNSGDDVTVNVSAGTGTVTSVAATVPTFLSVTGSPVTTSGTLAISLSGTALPVLNGGTGVTTSTGTTNVVLSNSPTLVTPVLGAASASSLSNSGNLTFTGTGNRITGDFSNGTVTNRVAFETSTTNGGTFLSAFPNGTSLQSGITFNNANSSTADRSNITILANTSVDVSLRSNIVGSGTYLPMTFYTGGSERVRIDTSGRVGIGTTTPTVSTNYGSLAVNGSSGSFIDAFVNGTRIGGFEADASNLYVQSIANVPMLFRTNSTERMRIDTSGNVGIGTSSPDHPLTVKKSFAADWVAKFTNQAANGISGFGYYDNSDTWKGYVGYDNGDVDFLKLFGTTGVGIKFLTANAERMRIDSSGNVLVTSAAGLGYGTGAGGTVTQATSRTTGVTLSKPTGAITMFSAAGSVVAATFTVTNTLVAATDTIILNQKSGTNLYVLLVTAVAAGSFNITFYTTGGVATDAPVINFSLIKGVTA